MEAVMLYSSPPDQSLSPYKPKRNHHHSFHFTPPNNFLGSVFHAPPPFLQQQQPPLLPLPIPKLKPKPNTSFGNKPLSGPHINRKTNNRKRGQSVTPTKSKLPISPTKGDSKRRDVRSTEECLVVASTKPVGPDPEDLPKDISQVFYYSDFEKFSGSVVFSTLSPPPSSLPLPTFSLRPKQISCNPKAVGIDAGATDNLRRLLRLR